MKSCQKSTLSLSLLSLKMPVPKNTFSLLIRWKDGRIIPDQSPGQPGEICGEQTGTFSPLKLVQNNLSASQQEKPNSLYFVAKLKGLYTKLTT